MAGRADSASPGLVVPTKTNTSEIRSGQNSMLIQSESDLAFLARSADSHRIGPRLCVHPEHLVGPEVDTDGEQRVGQ